MKYIFSAVISLTLIFASPAFAQLPVNNGGNQLPDNGGGSQLPVNQGGIDIKNPIKAGSLTEFFEMIIDVLLVFAVPLIVFFIIYAGFLYVTARGNEGTIQKAHMALLFAVIGGVIILGAKVLISVISGTVETFQP